jgi:hypothetical protein
MSKERTYQIEGNINFYQSLQQEEEVDYCDTNKCLITHEPLDPTTAVTLECHHTFNYLPLYQYVLISKTRTFTNLESTRLKASQLKCPFCRNVQNTLLPPPPPEIDAKLIHGVNCLEYSSVMAGTCSFALSNGTKCPSTSVYLCYHDNQTYCFHHRHLMTKKWEKEKQKMQTPKCTYMFVRGLHQGTVCGKTVTKNINCGLCVSHSKQKEQKEKKEQQEKKN